MQFNADRPQFSSNCKITWEPDAQSMQAWGGGCINSEKLWNQQGYAGWISAQFTNSDHNHQQNLCVCAHLCVFVCACLSEMDGFNPERGHLPCSQNSWQVTASRTGFVAFRTHRGQTLETCANMSASFPVTPDTHPHNHSTHILRERERDNKLLFWFHRGQTPAQLSPEEQRDGQWREGGMKRKKKTRLRWWIGPTAAARSKRLIGTGADW